MLFRYKLLRCVNFSSIKMIKNDLFFIATSFLIDMFSFISQKH